MITRLAITGSCTMVGICDGMWLRIRLIAVFDTGFLLDHEAFDSLVVAAQWDFIFDDDVTENEPEDPSPNQNNHGTQVLCPGQDGSVNHRVELYSIEGYVASYLGIDIDHAWTADEWLALPWQKLRSMDSM